MILSNRHWVARAVVDAAPKQVFADLVSELKKEVRSIDAGYQDSLEIDNKNRVATLTGHWWYQGTYKVRAHPDGTEVVHEVRNIARFGTRIISFLHKPTYSKETRRALNQILRRIALNG